MGRGPIEGLCLTTFLNKLQHFSNWIAVASDAPVIIEIYGKPETFSVWIKVASNVAPVIDLATVIMAHITAG